MKKIIIPWELPEGSQGYCKGPGTTLWELPIYKTMYFCVLYDRETPLSLLMATSLVQTSIIWGRWQQSLRTGFLALLPHRSHPWREFFIKCFLIMTRPSSKSSCGSPLPSHSSHGCPAPWSDCSQNARLMSHSGPLLCLVVLAKPSSTRAFMAHPCPDAFVSAGPCPSHILSPTSSYSPFVFRLILPTAYLLQASKILP